MKESLAFQQILDEGRKKGELKAHRTSLLAVVEFRFGKGGVALFKRVVESVQSPARLRALHKLALKCSDLDQLMAAGK